MDIVIIGLLLGGTYALMAMGLQLQYGVARIMNLANGEMLIAGAFGAFWFYAGTKVSPLVALLFVVPLAFGLNWAIYRVLILPLVRRAKNQGKLDVDSILATFGLSFIFIGIMVAFFGAQYTDYAYLSEPIFIFGERYGLNRVVAFLGSVVLCAALYLWLHKTRSRPGVASRFGQSVGGGAGFDQCLTRVRVGFCIGWGGDGGGRRVAQHVSDLRCFLWRRLHAQGADYRYFGRGRGYPRHYYRRFRSWACGDRRCVARRSGSYTCGGLRPVHDCIAGAA